MDSRAEYSHLQGWTPISFSTESGPQLKWADLRGYRFTKPFFFQTVAASREDASRPVHSTGLAALDALDSSLSLNPSLIIAHAARCGSTLLAAEMGALGGAMIVSEPAVLNRLLSHSIAQTDFRAHDVLRKVVRALGRVRFGDEKCYVLKLGSSLTRFLPEFRRAFPRIPMVWLQRKPAKIVESELCAPPWFGPDPIPAEDLPRLILHKLTTVFLAANAHVGDDMLVLDYEDLPDAAWTKVAPFMRVEPTDDELNRMREVTRYHAHTGKPFESREPQPLPDWVQAIVTQTLDPLYETLDRRRNATTAVRA